MTDENISNRDIHPKIRQIILIAFIAIGFTALWLSTYTYLNEILWMNDFVKANLWTIPGKNLGGWIGTLPFLICQ